MRSTSVPNAAERSDGTAHPRGDLVVRQRRRLVDDRGRLDAEFVGGAVADEQLEQRAALVVDTLPVDGVPRVVEDRSPLIHLDPLEGVRAVAVDNVDNEPFWTATNVLEMRNVDGVRIGTTASWFLEELNAQGDG